MSVLYMRKRFHTKMHRPFNSMIFKVLEHNLGVTNNPTKLTNGEKTLQNCKMTKTLQKGGPTNKLVLSF